MNKSKQKQTKALKKPKAAPSDQFLLARVGRVKLKENQGAQAERIFDRLFDIVAGRDPSQALQALRFVSEWCGPKTSTGLRQKPKASPAIERKPEPEQSEEELKTEIAELDAEIKELQSSIGPVAPANS